MGVVVGALMIVLAASVGVADAVSVGTVTDPDGTAEVGGRTPLGTLDEDTSPVVMGGETSEALVRGILVTIGGVDAVPVPAPVIPDEAEERSGTVVGRTEDTAETRVSVNGRTAVPVPAPEIPELTSAVLRSVVSVGVGRMDRGSVLERTVDNPTKRPVWVGDAAEETDRAESIVLAGTTEAGISPDDATKAGVGVAARGSTMEETTVANGSMTGVLAGTTELGIPPVDATSGVGVGMGDATRGFAIDETTEATGSAAAVLAGTIELGSPPVEATAAGVGVGVADALTRGAAIDDTAETIGSRAAVLAGMIELGSPPVEATRGSTIDETSGARPVAAELDAGAGVGADSVDAAGITTATLERTPKGSEDVSSAEARVDATGIASGLVIGADTGVTDDVDAAIPSPAATD